VIGGAFCRYRIQNAVRRRTETVIGLCLPFHASFALMIQSFPCFQWYLPKRQGIIKHGERRFVTSTQLLEGKKEHYGESGERSSHMSPLSDEHVTCHDHDLTKM
jgi:hypothetical protein